MKTNTSDDSNDPYAPATDQLLGLLLALSPSTVADVGCGSAGITSNVARALAPGAILYAIDADPTVFHTLSDEYTPSSCAIAPLVQDVNELTLPTTVDLLFCRFLLLDLKEPVAAVQRMRQWVRPGGRLVLMEPITSTGRVGDRPLSAESDEIVNPDIGLKLCELLIRAGALQLNATAFTPVGLGASLAGRYLAAMTGIDPDPASFIVLPTLVVASGQIQ
ncbi:class I SAM-dependent methyltransferase [Ferrimicrobium sp.]|uniref:class I SAM-dependent methyltransferase n=1 Tax=Ferrimicrobium sp. TaxID=2926050 RepID=UPI002638C71F|nr:class I SAM-dependent methyltransferase [Ferrimicrobium sp.]